MTIDDVVKMIGEQFDPQHDSIFVSVDNASGKVPGTKRVESFKCELEETSDGTDIHLYITIRR